MKEIKILIQQLRSYPDNFFAYPAELWPIKDGHTDMVSDRPIKRGLTICDMDGNQQGFIETGGKEGVIIS